MTGTPDKHVRPVLPSATDHGVPSSSEASRPETDVPVVVDLDGALIATDTLFEGTLALVRRHLWSPLLLAAWAARGMPNLKAQVVRRIRPAVDDLPYDEDLLEFLRAARCAGRRVVLATSAHHAIADAAAAHLGLFDEVLASTESINLRGRRKRDALVARFGVHGFDFIGGTRADVPVWAASRVAHAAGRLRRLPAAVFDGGARPGRSFARGPAGPRTWLRAMRTHQWVKNVLVFVPAILNRSIDLPVLAALLLTFLGFSFVASGSYIVNDLFDLQADRRHPRKRMRPLASGELSITQGLLMALLLLMAGFGLGALVGPALLACLLAYLTLTLGYSTFLKNKPIVDVIALTLLYTVRVYAGGLVSGAYMSPWLIQFSIFLFLSLAFLKRYSELRMLSHRGRRAALGRGYRSRDLSVIGQAGMGSGLLAGLVLALYVNGQEIERLYPHPDVLWAICPLFIYWITRAWLIAHRGNMNEDPILYAFGDRVSYIVGLLIVGVMLLGMLPNAG